MLQNEVVLENNDEDITVTFDKIEIPMIQRDYAQGREGEKEIRSRFLNAIFSTLSNDEQESLELDFIYGSFWKPEDKGKNKFIPLDGQQRLTTLFLLYWYIGLNELETDKWNQIKSSLSKFTYETRTSSRRFCENLVSGKTDKEIFQIEEALAERQPLSERIKNLPWFYFSYEKDPTIKSMLNMLDAIDEQYMKLRQSLWSKLSKLRFYILPMNGFGLSEELYIKMNARGKQLTGFENFKADIVNWMKDKKNPYYNFFQKEVDNNSRKMPYYLSISQKIDNDWTNFFWNISRTFDINAKEKGKLLHPEGKLIDPLFLRTIYRYFTNKYILNSSSDASKIEQEPYFIILMNEGKYQNFEPFEYLLNKENFVPDFEKLFDVLFNKWSTISKEIMPSWAEKEWSFYKENITQSDRVVFLAITLYLEKYEYQSTRFQQWMRVIWNIVENTDIADVRSMVGVMKLVQELSEYSPSIYEFLADKNNSIESTSSKNALAEERQKASFILSDPNWENTFIEAEKHPFFKGCVSFLITPEMSIQDFDHRYKNASKVFDKNGVNQEFRKEGHIFLRALISRFNDKSIIGKNFTDQDEKEHYLKKLLANNETVRNATREWFSIPFAKLKETLFNEVESDSRIPGWYYNNEWEKKRISRAHEALYKYPELQNWMQSNGAIRFSWANGHLYISRPRSWYDWIQLESIRNELISHLIAHGFNTEAKKIDGAPFFKGGNNIELFDEIKGVEMKITFDYLTTLKIESKTATSDWQIIQVYDYVEEDEKLFELLSKEKMEQLVQER